MALLDSEGFGFSTNASDYATYGVMPGGVLFSIGTGGPLGDNYASMAAGNPLKVLPSAAFTCFAGARINPNNNAYPFAVFADPGSVVQIQVQLSQGNIITVYRGGTLIGTSGFVAYPLDNWFYLEIGAVIASGTAGSVTVRINGATVYTLTGVDTQNTAGGVRKYIFASSSNAILTTHWYFCDNTGPAPWNTFLGDVRVQSVFPVSDDSVQFTPNGLASNWQNASRVPPVPGTDYNSDATVGHQDTFNCGAIAAGLTTVFGVNVKVLAAKSDAGSRSLETVLISGGTTSTGAAVALGTGAVLTPAIYQTDPNTSSAWTVSGVNAAKPGYKVSG